jgi:hypothetical protein
MSHCTKFDFTYSSEDAIVKAFRKLNIKCSTGMAGEYSSDFSKKILGGLGYAGHKQYRGIAGEIEDGHLFLLRIASNPQPIFLCPYKCPIAVNNVHYRPEPLSKLTDCRWYFTISPFPKSFWRR